MEGVPPHLLRNFYRDAYEALRDAAGTRPVLVLHDACLPDAWRAFMSPARYVNVWLDSHIYHYAESMNAAGGRVVERAAARGRRHDARGAHRA